jgi:hypothetical protein
MRISCWKSWIRPLADCRASAPLAERNGASRRGDRLPYNSEQTRFETETRDEFLAGGNSLNAFLVLKRALVVMISQTPTRFDAKKRAAVRPQGEIGNTRQVDHHRSSARRIGKREDAVGHVDEFQSVRAGKVRAFERHFAAVESDVFVFAAQKITGRMVPPVKAGRHLELERLERSCGEAGMQSEADVSRQFGFVVLEPERNRNAAAAYPISQVERNVEWIFQRGKISGRDAIDELVVAIRFDAMPDFCREESYASRRGSRARGRASARS